MYSAPDFFVVHFDEADVFSSGNCRAFYTQVNVHYEAQTGCTMGVYDALSGGDPLTYQCYLQDMG